MRLLERPNNRSVRTGDTCMTETATSMRFWAVAERASSPAATRSAATAAWIETARHSIRGDSGDFVGHAAPGNQTSEDSRLSTHSRRSIYVTITSALPCIFNIVLFERQELHRGSHDKQPAVERTKNMMEDQSRDMGAGSGPDPRMGIRYVRGLPTVRKIGQERTDGMPLYRLSAVGREAKQR